MPRPYRARRGPGRWRTALDWEPARLLYLLFGNTNSESKFMGKTLMWMVRAGEGGYLFEDFRKGSIVAIGWNEIGDLTGAGSQEEIRELYLRKYPAEKPAKMSNAVAMIFKCLSDKRCQAAFR